MKMRAPIFALLLLFSACRKDDKLQRLSGCEPYVTTAPAWTDACTVSSGVIEDDCLELVVSYSGGCQSHDFALYWDGMSLLTVPGRVQLSLLHNGNGDMCEAVITDSLHFDLTGIQDSTQGIASIDILVDSTVVLNVPYGN